MTTVKINKIKLIDIITKNRDEHIKEYRGAVKAYLAKLETTMAQISKQSQAINIDSNTLHKAKLPSFPHLQLPQSTLETYDSLIAMFTLSEDAVIELSVDEYNMYVNDEYDWRLRSKTANSSYL